MHVCGDISMFSSYQTAGTSTVLMGNGSSASVRRSEVYFREDRAAEEHALCPLRQ